MVQKINKGYKFILISPEFVLNVKKLMYPWLWYWYPPLQKNKRGGVRIGNQEHGKVIGNNGKYKDYDNEDKEENDPHYHSQLQTYIAKIQDRRSPVYKSAPLPVSFKWTTKYFEDFINDFSFHFGQQFYMRYILIPAFHTTYFRHGNDLYTVLVMANMMDLHLTVKYISIEQFQSDINYIYCALKQSLKSRGCDLVVTT